MFNQVSNVTIAGAGLYSWFDAYDQSVCVDAQNCQQRLIFDQGDNGELWIFNLVTIGAVEMISDSKGVIEAAKSNTQANPHPFWSALAVWGDESYPEILICDDEEDNCPSNPRYDTTLDYADLDALQAALDANTFEPECGPSYVVSTRENMLDTSLSAYDDANKGYDDVWGYYADAFRNSVGAMIQKFVAGATADNDAGGPGNKYFDCTITMLGKSTTKQCPFGFRELAFYTTFDMKYTLRDAGGFYNDLNKTFSIAKDWVTFYDLDNSSTQCVGGGGGGVTSHPGGGKNPPGRRSVADDHASEERYSNAGSHSPQLQKRCPRTGARFYGLPKAKSNFAVPNPKDVIVKAMPKMQNLDNRLIAKSIQMFLGDYNGAASDISQLLSLPVFMMASSIEQMESAKAEGQKIKNDKDLQFFLEMLGVVFMFLPFLDQLAPELLLLEGMATGMAFLGNTALAIKDMVENPENAFMDVLGIVMDGSSLKDAKGFKDAAAARKGISEDLIEKSGATIKKLDDKFQGFMGKTCGR